MTGMGCVYLFIYPFQKKHNTGTECVLLETPRILFVPNWTTNSSKNKTIPISSLLIELYSFRLQLLNREVWTLAENLLNSQNPWVVW